VRYNYIVIGSGAGGAAAAWRLARTGRSVLVLEKGGKLPTDGSTLDFDRVIRQRAFTSKELWRTPGGRTLRLKEYFNLGGKTKWSGGALVRFDRHEFDADPDYRDWCVGWV
jgi:choline dehydrogenase-like flavoprotein